MKHVRIQAPDSGFQNDVDSTLLDALEADLLTIPAYTIQASSGALRHFQNPQHLEDDIPATVPASSGAVRRMQVPVVSMTDDSGDEEPTHVDVVDEDPVEASDTESLGRDSDVASVVFSEVSTESVEEPAICQVANARGISRGLAQLDGFHLTEIFERRAHVMRVVPHVMRAAFCSAIRAACEEISSGFSLGDITRQERGWKLFLLLPRTLLCRPRRGGFVPRKDLEQRLALFHGGNWHELVSHSHPHGRASFPKSGAKRPPP